MELRLILLEALTGAHRAPVVYTAGLALGLLGIVVLALLPLVARRSRAFNHSALLAPSAFRLMAVALIVWARLPGLLPPLLNVDEGLFTAAAGRLLHDPVFWRSVDTGSSGPLNIFPLTLPAVIGLMPDLASSRLIGLAMMAASVCLLHAALGRLYDEQTARLATLPVVTTVALFRYFDFVHYSSEHVPILLMSLMLCLLSVLGRNVSSSQTSKWLLFGIGLCAGLMPFAKMQGVPIAIALCLVAVHMLWLQNRGSAQRLNSRLAWLGAGSVSPFAVAALYLTVFSIWESFWHSYLQTNLIVYASLNLTGTASKSTNFIHLLRTSPDLIPLAVLTAVVSFFGIIFYVITRKASTINRDLMIFKYTIYAAIYFLAAATAVALPGNPFHHYLLFLIMPMGFLIGAILGDIRRFIDSPGHVTGPVLSRGPAIIAILVVLSAALSGASKMWQGNSFLSRHESYLQNFRGPIAQAIRRVAAPGSTMAVWGWSPDLTVESAMIQSGRYGFSFWQIEKYPLQGYFIDEYVSDLERARPRIFVDAMAPGRFYFVPIDRARHGHDAFPSIAELVRKNYTLVDEVQGVRIYARGAGR